MRRVRPANGFGDSQHGPCLTAQVICFNQLRRIAIHSGGMSRRPVDMRPRVASRYAVSSSGTRDNLTTGVFG